MSDSLISTMKGAMGSGEKEVAENGFLEMAKAAEAAERYDGNAVFNFNTQVLIQFLHFSFPNSH